MQTEQAFDFVRKILKSPIFHALPFEEKTKTLEKILLTGEITKENLSFLINEALQQQNSDSKINKLKEDSDTVKLLPVLERFDYNTFLNFILRGEIKGKDLLNLCNSSKKFNDYCNKDFDREDKDGNIVKVETQYLFRLLLNKIGVRFIPFNKTPKQFYIERLIGGNVLVFGNNDYGRTGLPYNRVHTIPVPILSLKNIIQVSTGRNHSLCLNNQGRVYSFGSNGKQEKLGLGYNSIRNRFTGRIDNVDKHSPMMINDLENIIQVSAGINHSLCLDNQGRVWNFGDGSGGQLGPSVYKNITGIPALILGLKNIVQVAAGEYYSLCLDNQGIVRGFGQLGLKHYENLDSPILENIIQVDIGTGFSLCLDNDGKVWVFGSNMKLGLGYKGDFTEIPRIVSGLDNIIQVSAGDSHSLCLDNQGRVWSFGFNLYGELGVDNRKGRESPTLISTLNNIVQVSAGNNHSLCLDNQGRVWSFGHNKEGQLGLGSYHNEITPTLIPGLDQVFQISAGRGISFVIKF
jgi:alpha-tubulin suppressor-like RCC1 family protein